MITDLEIEKARRQIASAITIYNYNLNKRDSNFPKSRILVTPDRLMLELPFNRSLLEFSYAGWHCYVSHNDSVLGMGVYLERTDNMHVEFSGKVGGLSYLIANERPARIAKALAEKAEDEKQN
jgi:hypothetical protein